MGNVTRLPGVKPYRSTIASDTHMGIASIGSCAAGTTSPVKGSVLPGSVISMGRAMSATAGLAGVEHQLG